MILNYLKLVNREFELRQLEIPETLTEYTLNKSMGGKK